MTDSTYALQTPGGGPNVDVLQVTWDGQTVVRERIENRNEVVSAQTPVASKSTGNVASLAAVYGSNNGLGNTLVAVCTIGNSNTAPTIADTNTNSNWKLASVLTNATFTVAIFFCAGSNAGANTVTVTNVGTTASMALCIYELAGVLTYSATLPDQSVSGQGSSAIATAPVFYPDIPNSIAIAGVALGTAAQTITPATGWTNDSGQQNPTTPSGVFSFVSMSQFLEDVAATTPSATFTSEPWVVVACTFNPIAVPVSGLVKCAPNLPRVGCLSAAKVNINSATDNTVITGIAGQTIRVFRWRLFVNDADVTISVKDSTPTTLQDAMKFFQGASDVMPLDSEPWFTTAAGKGFILTLAFPGATSNVVGVIYYQQS